MGAKKKIDRIPMTLNLDMSKTGQAKMVTIVYMH